MTIFPTWLTLMAIGMILLMVAYGIGFFAKRDLTLKLTGHTVTGATDIVGARFLFLAALGAAFLLLGNAQAITVLLGLGVLLAASDAILERRHGGAVLPHVVVGGGAAVLCYFFYSVPMSGAS